MNIYLLVIFLNNVLNFFIGILLGAGAILPGISSGVICVILGIYDKLVDSILNLFKDFKQNFMYLFPIGLGGLLGVFLFGNILKSLFEVFPSQTSFCFIGLILGSIPILIKKVNSEHTFKLRYSLFTLFTFILGCIFVFLENKFNLSNDIGNFSFAYLLMSGFLMSIGVVFPGVSNTLILMCLRSLFNIFKYYCYYEFKYISSYRNWSCYRGYIFLNSYKILTKTFLHANLLFNNRFYIRQCISVI